MKKIYIVSCLVIGLALNAFAPEAFSQNPQSKPVVTLTKEQAKRKSIQSGEFRLEEATKAKDPHAVGRDATLAYFTSLQSVIKSLAGGSSAKAPELNEDGIHYLGGAYLYCSVNKGTCPFILDSLLEADVINARHTKQDACPTLRGFWKDYLSNDLENRHKYATKIGFLAETGEFNTKQRPKYIKCVDTVKTERADTASDSEFFKARYANEAKLESVNKSLEFIKHLKDKDINVFNEIRAMR